MESDRKQEYRTVASVIDQQYSWAIFVSLRFRPHMEKFGGSFKNIISNSEGFVFFKYVS
jgi:hypothetical protein